MAALPVQAIDTYLIFYGSEEIHLEVNDYVEMVRSGPGDMRSE